MMTKDAGAVRLNRETFRTSRLMEFCSQKELVSQTGHQVDEWPLVVLKELIDNALDACELAGTAPRISIAVDESGITIQDNGPGIPESTIEGVLDFSVRTSSNDAYVSPTRGAQGNALKTLVAMPFILFGPGHGITVRAHGAEHRIRMRVDPIRQQPFVESPKSPADGFGTFIKIDWPNSASSTGGANGHSLQNGCGDSDDPDNRARRSASLIGACKSRFLQIAENYCVLNPHLSLDLSWHGEVVIDIQAVDPEWQKWLPSDPTSSHWYDPERFERLLAACIASDEDRGKDRTVREFVATFCGLTGTAKQKVVLSKTKLARAKLSEFRTKDGIDHDKANTLLSAMKSESKPIKPVQLGLIGRKNVHHRLLQLRCGEESIEYATDSGETDGVPWIAEVAFGYLGDVAARRIVTGVNWSAAISNPFRQLGVGGPSLDTLLTERRASENEPIVFLMHVACPRVEYRDRGKSSLVISAGGLS